MGIRISFREKKSPFSKFFPTTERVLESITRTAQQKGYHFRQAGDELFMVEFCPAGLLTLNTSRETLAGETQTNTVGPGFHKAVIDFLDEFTQEIKLELEVLDEAGYHSERDFPELQQKHLNWLDSVLKIVRSQRSQRTTLHVNWPAVSWKPVGWNGMITPQGVFSFDTIDPIGLDQGLVDFAKRFFIWFNEAQDAYFNRGAALYLMWHDFSWTTLTSEADIALAKQILVHLSAARTQNKQIPLPLAEWKEIANLAGQPADMIDGPALSAEGLIGYRREKILISFPGGWTAELPGQMMDKTVGDERVFWDADREFHLAPYFAAPGKSGPDGSSLPEINFTGDMTKILRQEVNGYSYKAKWEPSADHWKLEGVITGQDKFAIVTITWQDAQWQPWAVDTFIHVQPPDE